MCTRSFQSQSRLSGVNSPPASSSPRLEKVRRRACRRRTGMRDPIFMHQRQPTGGLRRNATQNGQTDPRTPCRSPLCRKSPLSRVGTSRQSRKSLKFAPPPNSSREFRLTTMMAGPKDASSNGQCPLLAMVFDTNRRDSSTVATELHVAFSALGLRISSRTYFSGCGNVCRF